MRTQVERYIVDQDYSNIIELVPTSREAGYHEEESAHRRSLGIWAELADIQSGKRTIKSFLDV